MNLPQETLSEALIWSWLEDVKDPEIPVVNVIEMGIVRKVELVDNKPIITITPTYSGCPAMNVIEEDIIAKLQREGVDSYEVNMVFNPAWTTDWMTAEGKEKMRKYGIAPPGLRKIQSLGRKPWQEEEPEQVPCPKCGSKNTSLKSNFGSTACKALYFCESCKDPFDYFKCH